MSIEISKMPYIFCITDVTFDAILRSIEVSQSSQDFPFTDQCMGVILRFWIRPYLVQRQGTGRNTDGGRKGRWLANTRSPAKWLQKQCVCVCVPHILWPSGRYVVNVSVVITTAVHVCKCVYWWLCCTCLLHAVFSLPTWKY